MRYAYGVVGLVWLFLPLYYYISSDQIFQYILAIASTVGGVVLVLSALGTNAQIGSKVISDRGLSVVGIFAYSTGLVIFGIYSSEYQTISDWGTLLLSFGIFGIILGIIESIRIYRYYK